MCFILVFSVRSSADHPDLCGQKTMISLPKLERKLHSSTRTKACHIFSFLFFFKRNHKKISLWCVQASL